MPTNFDAIIIGTGQAGPPLAARLAKEGLRTAVCERQHFGGSCVNFGCTPTKTLVASARAAYMARRAKDFGVILENGPVVNMQLVQARKERTVLGARDGLGDWLKGLDNVTVFENHARFIGEKTVAVGEEELTAEKIFIDVGARSAVPPISGLDAVDYFTAETIVNVDFVPAHLIIVGGSYIGLEFAQMFRRFGSQITILERGERLLSRDDEDVSAAVRQILEAEGVDVFCNARVDRVSAEQQEVDVHFEHEGATRKSAGTHLLLATGRTPNTDDLGLEAAGVEADERGFIPVNERCETNAAGIWALGDVNGRGAFTHTSYNDYELVAANLFDNADRKISDRIETSAVFIDPPLGRVGLTERAARERGGKLLIAKMPMSKVARARERSETHGFMKVIIDGETERVLGATVLGVSGDEVVHALTALMYADAPYTAMRDAVHIHPTVCELLPTLLQQVAPLE